MRTVRECELWSRTAKTAKQPERNVARKVSLTTCRTVEYIRITNEEDDAADRAKRKEYTGAEKRLKLSPDAEDTPRASLSGVFHLPATKEMRK